MTTELKSVPLKLRRSMLRIAGSRSPSPKRCTTPSFGMRHGDSMRARCSTTRYRATAGQGLSDLFLTSFGVPDLIVDVVGDHTDLTILAPRGPKVSPASRAPKVVKVIQSHKVFKVQPEHKVQRVQRVHR